MWCSGLMDSRTVKPVDNPSETCQWENKFKRANFRRASPSSSSSIAVLLAINMLQAPLPNRVSIIRSTGLPRRYQVPLPFPNNVGYGTQTYLDPFKVSQTESHFRYINSNLSFSIFKPPTKEHRSLKILRAWMICTTNLMRPTNKSLQLSRS